MIAQILMLIGSFFMFVAALGVFRMPDLYMRLQSNTKSATFGVGFIMLGAAFHFWEFAISIRALAILLFLFVTSPVAAHLLGRSAYIAGAPLWEGTLSDDLKGKYDQKTHELTTEESEEKKTKPRKTGVKRKK
jgi:multicomponent Na+:H+ antiporter subunit G